MKEISLMPIKPVHYAITMMCIFWALGGGSAFAFPSWMGVYGSYLRHNGGNPGVFTVLMNQDYWGLHAEVGISVNGGAFNTYGMTYIGNASGNSIYEFIPWWEFPATQIVDFYFHGWDDWGGNIWDSNGGQNYWFPAHHNGRVQWVGNTWNYPSNGSITSNDNFWVNIETWPAGATKEGMVVYTVNRGLTWKSTNLSFNGQAGNNDKWHVNMGKFGPAVTLRYAIIIKDWVGSDHWDNNGGFDFYSLVNYDPYLDQDGDGMPNGWEIAHGFDPASPQDAGADNDGDGLSNVAEFAAGTDPSVQDTDNDGLNDAIEVLGTHTDPLTANTHTLNLVLTINGADATNTVGVWSTLNGVTINTGTNRGVAEYVFTVSSADTYLLNLDGYVLPYLAGISRPADLDVYINGEWIQRVLWTPELTNTVTQCITPYLQQGTHSIRVVWDNDRAYNRLTLSNIKLYSLAGPDTNNDGIKDWVENWLTARNGADLLPPSSAVSPAFLEGRVAYFGLMSASSGVALKRGAGARWYADVPLNPTQATQVVLSYEGGVLLESEDIEWDTTNLILGHDMTLREGDALLLTAYPLGAVIGDVDIEIDGVPTYATTIGTPVAHTFSTAGSYVLTGIHDDGILTTNNITVTVVAASFDDSPAAWLGKVRGWNCSNINTGLLLEFAPHIYYADTGSLPGGGRSFNLRADNVTPAYAVVRLGNGGAILDNIEVRGFNLFSSGQVRFEIVETYSDGTELVEMDIVHSPLLPDTVIDLEIFAGGITFDDGSLFKQLDAADFNELNQTTVRFFKGAGVQNSSCHRLRVYQNGVLLGER
ncbi:MAG TPA: hypothetical protein PJ991_09350 [Kiritimatiellia bacterium]|nr:hypothetical protein [Kiritimatiellia bacterium]